MSAEKASVKVTSKPEDGAKTDQSTQPKEKVELGPAASGLESSTQGDHPEDSKITSKSPEGNDAEENTFNHQDDDNEGSAEYAASRIRFGGSIPLLLEASRLKTPFPFEVCDLK